MCAGVEEVRGVVQFRVLGSLEVRQGDRPVTLGSQRQRTLLAVLLVHAGAVVSVDALAEALWGEQQPADPRNAIQTYVARLRDALGEPGAALVTRNPGYALEVDAAQVDALRFERLLDEAHAAGDDPHRARTLLDEALGLWRGAAYAEFVDGVARMEAVRLEERRLVALEAHAEARLALGEAAALIGELGALVAAHPLRERVVELHMRALAAVDRQADALAAYRSYRDRLADETGLEPGAAIRDLERRILQGQLGRPVPSGDDTGPAASTRSAVPTDVPDRAPAGVGAAAPAGVPIWPTSLVGREREIADARAALERERVVTLTGTGGVGKTRIAAAVAGSVAGECASEVAWVELAPVTDPAAVEHAIAAALGIDLSGAPAQDALIRALGSRSVLLVLDNCEHLLDTVAPLVDRVRQDCPAVRFLATSRERLALDGEHVRPVAPLPVGSAAGAPDASPAVRLFLDRAAAVTPGLDLRDRLPVVVAICQQLDGLPLAIELAAARAGALAPEDLLAALGDDVKAAVGSRRGRLARHRDLWTVVDWSYRLLAPEERALFDRLSVFAGAFDLAVAHDVCAPDGQPRSTTLEQLALLVERSLLVGPGTDSAGYRMLRPLRAFARQRLADRGEFASLAERHAAVFVARAEAAAGPPLTDEGHRWLRAAVDDLRAVRRRAQLAGDIALLGRLITACYRFDYWRPGTEMLAWADDALDLPGIEREPTAPQVHAAAVTAAWMRGDLDRARGLADRAVSLGSGTDDVARAYAYEAVADVAFFEGRLADAEAAFRETVRLGRLGDDPDSELNGRVGIALALAYTGRIEEAIEEADGAARDAERAGSAIQAFARYAQGECRAEVAPEEAIAFVEQAVELARACDAWFVEGVALLTAVSLRGRHGAPVEALPAFADLLHHWRRSGNWTQQWTTLRNLAELFVRLEADEPAVSIAAAADAEDTAAPLFGTELDRLGRALDAARRRLGAERFDAARRRGEQLEGDEVVDLALAAVADLTAPRPGQPG